MNEIYIFDFDDTLVRISSTVQIIERSTGNVITEYYPSQFFELYEPNKQEYFSFVDGDQYSKLPFFNILKEAASKQDAGTWICTARYSPDGPVNILEKENVSNVQVAAVGKQEKMMDGHYLSRRKRAFVAKLIRKYRPEKVFFYDDSPRNLYQVGTLAERLKTKIVLIDSTDYTVKIMNPS